MRRNRLFWILGIVCLTLAFVAVGLVLAAPVVIDTFNDGNGSGGEGVVCSGGCFGGLIPSSSATTIPSGVLGDERDMIVTRTSGSGNVFVYVNQGGTSEILRLAQDPSTGGKGQLQWDGSDNSLTLDTVGLGGRDLTDGFTNDGIQLLVPFADGNFDLKISVYTGTNYSDYTLSLVDDVSAPGQSYFIPFTSFTVRGGTGADFTDVGAVTFDIEPQELAVDLEVDLLEATAQTDWGDLPETGTSYPTSSGNNGPRHIRGDLYLGASIDLEADGLPMTNADGDDDNNFSDEDGIRRVTLAEGGSRWCAGCTGEITATVTGSIGDLYAWFDWNNDGDFSDANEAQSWTGLTAGDHRLSVTVDSSFNETELYARFRLVPTGDGDPGLTGETTNGEVEDYYWGAGDWNPNAVSLTSVVAGPAVTTLFAVGLLLLAALGGVGLLITKRRA